MENPATWNDDVWAVQKAIDRYNTQVAQGIFGYSLAKIIEMDCIAPLREKLNRAMAEES